ncbi:tRNA (guanosine(18)-2'-O)-methyltransferase [Enhygromyxa salina]|uniref:tRNA (Guanosine(18)-2'-O)-methyltransferase n=1 Tax=Enhygromyxa salina TaxID=215803 RepID=A0A2S9XX38_9BACT|nr:RNA methyltransferase [Enhygromyxa salina]PRP97438.1 tRNA (guanosine(18)-2'-O)-methyltransferase [Enhygromyxa salina]
MTRAEFDRLARHYGADAIVDGLRPYVSERRQARIEGVLEARLRSVEVAIENPYDPHNAAAVVRSAEALGAWAVHVIAASERILRARGTTKGTHHWIETRHHAGFDGFVTALAERSAERGMLLAGACVDATHMLDELPTERPICLLFGNEHAGLSAEAQAACSLRFRVPIHGFAESYNLSVAAALSLYSLTQRRRAALGRAGDLDPETRALERARWYMRSVDSRHARILFPAPDADAELK